MKKMKGGKIYQIIYEMSNIKDKKDGGNLISTFD